MAQRSAADWLLMLLGGAAIFLLVATGLAWVAFDSHLPSKASANM